MECVTLCHILFEIILSGTVNLELILAQIFC